MPESPGAEKQDKEKDHRDSKKSRGERLSLLHVVLYPLLSVLKQRSHLPLTLQS